MGRLIKYTSRTKEVKVLLNGENILAVFGVLDKTCQEVLADSKYHYLEIKAKSRVIFWTIWVAVNIISEQPPISTI